MESRHVAALLVHFHLARLELVELPPDGGLVAGGEAGPRLVRGPVVLLAVQHVDIVRKLGPPTRQPNVVETMQ